MALPPIRGRFRFAIRVVFLLALASLTSSGYQQRLDSEAIREAYNLGRKNNQETTAFLAQYFRSFSTPTKGPYVASIEVLTPYAQLVNNAMLDMVNENVFELQRKYASRAGVLFVRVRVYSTPTRTLPYRDEDIWKEFTVRASQEDVLKSEKKSLNHVYPADDSGTFDYADMELQFDAKNVASVPITIDVSSPDGQHVEAKFDLSKLK
jgi:hypothetical protein